MEEGFVLSQINFFEEDINEEEVKLKIKEIEEKIKNKAESILAKEDIDYTDYQILNSYAYDLKRKIDDAKRKDANEEIIQLMSKALTRNI